MPRGEGKGWAKGRKAESDPRIAKNADAHRGQTYFSHIAPDQDRRRRSPPFAAEWTPILAYAVGLLATDGCQTDGRHLAFPSADRELVEILLRCLGKTKKIATVPTRTGGVVYRTQIGDVLLCRWLLGVGVTPRKSLTLGGLAVPDLLVLECARGLLDGDGSVSNFTHRPTKRKYPHYRYERLYVEFNSASRAHLEWLRSRLAPWARRQRLVEHQAADARPDEYCTLRYGKHASLRLLPQLYRNASVPRLERKWRVWDDFRRRHCAEGGT